MPLTLDEIERYHRQVLLPEWGPAGQEALGAASVQVLGHGAAATTAVRYLAGAGVGRLVVDDPALAAAAAAVNPLVASEVVGPSSAALAGEAAGGAPRRAQVELIVAGSRLRGDEPADREALGAALALEALKAILGLPHHTRVQLPPVPGADAPPPSAPRPADGR